MTYQERVVDRELDELLPHLGAIALEGPKGVGKTATAMQRARTVLKLDDDRDRTLLAADLDRLDTMPGPVLLDEWQRLPAVWDAVRRSVDHQGHGGRFLLAGSASPREQPAHSGAGRIVRLRMRPMSLAERGLGLPTVSLGSMLAGTATVAGSTTVRLQEYAEEILASGFPGIRPLPRRARNVQIDSYLARIADIELIEQGYRVAKPASLRAWMTAFAAATATTASYNTILDAATPGESDKPARSTTEQYRDALGQLFLIDPLPGWIPALNPLSRLAQAPKHHLADPALAARLLGASAASLLAGTTEPSMFGDRPLLGALFESLVTLSVRTYAQPHAAGVHHLRTQNGDHEVDLIVEGDDRRVVALEVKLGAVVTDADVRHLRWLRERLGRVVADAAVITTGAEAYRRPDGIAVVPAALLGP